MTLHRVKCDMVVLLSNCAHLVDEQSYVLRHVRDFEELSNRHKMRNRVLNLLTVFFENAIKAVTSGEKVENERHFLVRKFASFDKPKFKYFDFEKMWADANKKRGASGSSKILHPIKSK